MSVPTVDQLITEFAGLGILHQVDPAPESYGALLSRLYDENQGHGLSFDAEGFTSAADYRRLLDTFGAASGGAFAIDGMTLAEIPDPDRWNGPDSVIITLSATLGGEPRSIRWIQNSDWVDEGFLDFVDALVTESTSGRFLTIPTWDQGLRLFYVSDRTIVERVDELLRDIYRVPYREVFPGN